MPLLRYIFIVLFIYVFLLASLVSSVSLQYWVDCVTPTATQCQQRLASQTTLDCFSLDQVKDNLSQRQLSENDSVEIVLLGRTTEPTTCAVPAIVGIPYFVVGNGQTWTIRTQGATADTPVYVVPLNQTISNQDDDADAEIFITMHSMPKGLAQLTPSALRILGPNLVFANFGTTAFLYTTAAPGSSLQISDSSVINNTVSAIEVVNSNVRLDLERTIVSGNSDKCNTTSQGRCGGAGVFIVGSGQTVNIVNCTFERNRIFGRLVFGAAMMILNQQDLLNVPGPRILLQGSSFIDNYAESVQRTTGGAVSIDGHVHVSVIGCTFSNNAGYSNGDVSEGGALGISSNNGTTLIEDTVFLYNQANIANPTRECRGGALMMRTRANVTTSFIQDAEEVDTTVAGIIRRSSFFENRVYVNVDVDEEAGPNGQPLEFTGRGGAIEMFGSGVLVVEDTIFVNNSAASHGGAMFLSLAFSLVLQRVGCINNEAATGLAGCIFLYGAFLNGFTRIEDSYFISNKAGQSGGAIFLLKGKDVNIRNTSFLGNSCSVNGGGLSLDDLTTAKIEDCLFSNNRADLEGGGLYLNSVYDDVQKGIGHGAYVRRSHFADNFASNGGALATSGYTIITVSQSVFMRNHAFTVTGRGGAISLSGKSVAVNDVGLQFTVGTTIESSVFIENKAGEGGAISSLNTDVWAQILSTAFDHNSADAFGGAIQMQSARAFISQCTFSSSEADHGGTISASGGRINVRYSSFSGSKSKGSPSTKNFWHGGGGCVLVRRTFFVMDHVSFSGCTASTDGGAVLCTSASSCFITHSNVTYSKSLIGGGLHCYDSTACAVSRSTFSNNKADTGAAFGVGNFRAPGQLNNPVTIVLDRVNVTSNEASIAGGALAVHKESASITVVMENTTLAYNSAVYGGAIALRVYNQYGISFSDIDPRGSRLFYYDGYVQLTGNNALAGSAFFVGGYVPTSDASSFLPNDRTQYSRSLVMYDLSLRPKGYGPIIATAPMIAAVSLMSPSDAQTLFFGALVTISEVYFKDLFGQNVTSFAQQDLFPSPKLYIQAKNGVDSCGISGFRSGWSNQTPSREYAKFVSYDFTSIPDSTRKPWLQLYGNSSLGPLRNSVFCPLVATVFQQQLYNDTQKLLSSPVSLTIEACNLRESIAEQIYKDEERYACNRNSACPNFSWLSDYIIVVRIVTIVAIVLLVINFLLCLFFAAAIMFQRIVGSMRFFVLRVVVLLLDAARLGAIALTLGIYSDIPNIEFNPVLPFVINLYGLTALTTSSAMALLLLKMSSYPFLNVALVKKRNFTIRLVDVLIIALIFVTFAAAVSIGVGFGASRFITTSRTTISVFAQVIGSLSLALLVAGILVFELSMFSAQPWRRIAETLKQRRGHKLSTLVFREILRYTLPIACCISLYGIEFMMFITFLASNECTVLYFAAIVAGGAVLHMFTPFLVRGMLGQIRQKPKKMFTSSSVEFDHGIDVAMIEQGEDMIVDSAMLSQILPKHLIIEPDELVYHEQIGQGAQAVVFRGRYQNSDVAIKAYAKSSFGGPADLKAFFVELKNLVNCSHHVNVVRFLGVSNDDEKGRIAIIMEYCAKGSLAMVLRKERLPQNAATRMSFPQRISLLAGIAAGMRYLHSKDLVHRDLKAENILLSDDMTPKITDFGIAKFLSTATNLTSGIGTIAYLAPESLREQSKFAAQQHEPSTRSRSNALVRLFSQARTRGNSGYKKLDKQTDSQQWSKLTRAQSYNERVDVYSFGILAYVLLTGRTEPYGDLTEVDIAIGVSRGANFRPSLDPDVVPAIREAIDTSNRWVIGLIEECWSADSEDRPSFDHLSDRLQLMKESLRSKG